MIVPCRQLHPVLLITSEKRLTIRLVARVSLAQKPSGAPFNYDSGPTGLCATFCFFLEVPINSCSTGQHAPPASTPGYFGTPDKL